jgi:hypothetical protein
MPYIPVLMKSAIPLARKHCANWNRGNCLGCMFVRVGKALIMRLDEKFVGKPCVVDKGCEYFDEIVTKGIQ